MSSDSTTCFPWQATSSRNTGRSPDSFWRLKRFGRWKSKVCSAAFPVNVKLEVPKGWQSDPKQIHQHLVGEGALDLTESGIETYKAIKTAWDAPRS